MNNSNHYILKYRKVRIDDTLYWDIHRGGWKYVVETLKSEVHSEDGILLLNATEDHIFHGKPLEEPWIGFVHQVPKTNLKVFPDLERLLKYKTWVKSLKYCQGIFTLSNYLKEYLDNQNLPIKVNRLFYPIDFDVQKFDFNSFESKQKKVLLIGEYQRNFQSFFSLRANGFKKTLLENDSFKRQNFTKNPSVKIVPRLSDEEYDSLLAESLVFLDLIDAPANTTVIECIVRNTPILINKLRGVVEYLGDSYPFYYNSIEEADEKLGDMETIRRAYEYLVSMNKEKITKEYFIESLHSSPIYRSLDIPNDQKDEIFKRYDISVVITSYNRAYNIRELLNRFYKQKFGGTFEIILWNNNISSMVNLDLIYEQYKDKLNIKLIHSTENYYCAMRLAMAHIMQSDHLLICDDDVQPDTHYIQRFWDKYLFYGPDTVLCARGHKFEFHDLNEEFPDEVWKYNKHIKFYDEAEEDVKIHFLHADNCLIPRSILLKINKFEWDNLDFILVDDYWVSYIVSHKLKIPIWKIKFDDQFSFTPCANDENIALFHNPKVRKKRVDFYIYHMKKGWPASVIKETPDSYQPELVENGNETPSENQMHLEKNAKRNQQSLYFQSYDLSIVICTYTRSFNLKRIIQRFREQDTLESFELIIWNNNYSSRQELNELYSLYMDDIDIKIIHSTENILCKPRLALSSLLRGKRVIFCDDDVMPEKNYLSQLSKYHHIYGSNTLICVSGESFISNKLDEDRPYLMWKKDNIKWHTHDEPSCLVHYFHANSCILSRRLLKEASTYSYPKPELAWIDDYWLSYLFSHILGIELRKINARSFLSFTNESDSNDSKIALSRNPNIKYHKVAFFLYHYQKNWRPCLKE